MTNASVQTRNRPASSGKPGRHGARDTAHVGGLVGLAARGVLYIVLAFLSLELVVGHHNRGADTRGALHELSDNGFGVILLVLLAVGFAAFALWHLAAAWLTHTEVPRRLADTGRAVVYGVLCALAITFVATPARSGNSDRTDQTWTAKILDWSVGPVLVGAIGVAVVGAGCYLVWRVITGGPQDEQSVLDAAPRDTPLLHKLGAVGNLARGAVLALIGVFVCAAAIQHDPGETVGLDGALKRLLDESFGGFLVALVALGFAAFGVYSIARAWVNRGHASSLV